MRTTNRRIILASLGLLLLGAVFIVPAGRYAIIGWLRGESFYQGRPTSYWHSELREWEFHVIARPMAKWPPEWCYGWLCEEKRGLLDRLMDPEWQAYEQGLSPLLMGDPDALPVLMVLLKSEQPAIRHQAVFGLGRIGPQARPALPLLLEMWQHGQNKIEITDGLEEYDFGPDICDAIHRIDPAAAKQAGIPGPFSEMVDDIHFVTR